MGKLLEKELKELQRRVATMAHSVQQALGASVAALLDADTIAAQIVYEGDQAMNAQAFAVEADVVAVIATQQPVAGDVRLLVSILEIATELERMGDYAKDIARIAIRQAAHSKHNIPVGIVHMADQATSMLERAIQALNESDSQLATMVAKEDDDVDNSCMTIHRNLVEHARSDDAAIEEAIRLLPAVHNIERFADRVTNICERIVYIKTGERVEFDHYGQDG